MSNQFGNMQTFQHFVQDLHVVVMDDSRKRHCKVSGHGAGSEKPNSDWEISRFLLGLHVEGAIVFTSWFQEILHWQHEWFGVSGVHESTVNYVRSCLQRTRRLPTEAEGARGVYSGEWTDVMELLWHPSGTRSCLQNVLVLLENVGLLRNLGLSVLNATDECEWLLSACSASGTGGVGVAAPPCVEDLYDPDYLLIVPCLCNDAEFVELLCVEWWKHQREVCWNADPRHVSNSMLPYFLVYNRRERGWLSFAIANPVYVSQEFLLNIVFSGGVVW